MSALYLQEPTHTHIHIQINQNQTQKKKSLLSKGHRLLFVSHYAATLKAPSSIESGFREALRPDVALKFKTRRALAWVCEGLFTVFIWAHDFYLPPLFGESASSLPPSAYLRSLFFTWCPAAAVSTHWRPKKAYVQNYTRQVVKCNVICVLSF